MFFGLCFSVIIYVLIYFGSDKCDFNKISKKTFIFPAIAGIGSAVLNLFIIMLIASPMSESVFFPGIAVGGLILTTLFSVVFYKEKLSPKRWTGLFLGIVALVFLNI